MKTRSFTHLAIAGFTALSFSQPLMAQYNYMPYEFYTTLPQMQIQHNMQMQALQNASVQPYDDISDEEEVAPPNPKDALTYVPSLQVRRTNFARIVDQTRPTDPALANRLQQVFAASDLIKELDKVMQPIGLSSNNVADAFTIYLVSAWDVIHNRNMSTNPKVHLAVKEQMESVISSVPSIISADDATKQGIAESFLVQTLLLSVNRANVGSNSVEQQAFAESVNQGAKTLGLDLSNLNLTEQGFVAK